MQTAIESDHRDGYALVLCDNDADGRIPPSFPVLRSRSLRSTRKYRHLFVLCSTLHLPQAARFVSDINRAHKLQALFVRSDSDPALLPQMLERAKLRLIRNILVHSGSAVPRRVLAAWQRNAQSELIASATVANDRLIVVSCEPKTYEVGFDRIPALKKISLQQRNKFEIDEDGSFIWWPSEDIHLDLDAIRSVIDPVWRRKSERLRRLHGREYGHAIAALRRAHGLKQTEVPGISERQLRRVEQSGAVSVRSLEKLAKAHGMPLDSYLAALAHNLQPSPMRTDSVARKVGGRAAAARAPINSSVPSRRSLP
jgi:transcriptional regulator with XRE-family HTH domain